MKAHFLPRDRMREGQVAGVQEQAAFLVITRIFFLTKIAAVQIVADDWRAQRKGRGDAQLVRASGKGTEQNACGFLFFSIRAASRPNSKAFPFSDGKLSVNIV